MSELGLSFHFWCASRQSVREFVLAQSTSGRIVASNPRWTCFVPFDRQDERALLGAWTGLVMKWYYSEDYALALEFHGDGRGLGVASFVWGTAVTGDPPGGVFEEALRAELISIGVLSAKAAEDWDRALEDCAGAVSSGEILRDRVAAILGLAALEFISPELCLEVDLEEARESHPEAEDIECESHQPG